MASPIYISSSWADAAARSNTSPDGSWYQDIPGGLQLAPGAQMSVYKAYLHIPGSSSTSAGAIRIATPITTTVRAFPYYVVADSGNAALDLGIVRNVGQSYFGQLQALRQFNSGNLLTFDVQIVVPAGTYEPAQLAALITAQTRELRSTLPPIPQTVEILPRAQGLALMDSDSFDTAQGLAPWALVDLNFPAGQGLSTGAAPKATFGNTPVGVPVGATNGITLFYSAQSSRFSISDMTTPLYDTQGTLCAARNTFTLANGIRSATFVGSSGGLAVPNATAASQWFLPPVPAGGCSYWAVDCPTWEDSIWSVLGFAQADLERNDYGGFARTDAIITPSMLASGAALGATYANYQTYVLDASATTTALLASGAPQASGPGFYELEVQLVPTNYSDASGRLPSTVGCVDAAYPSQDTLTAEDMPPHVVSTPTTVSGVRCRFRNGVTKAPVIPGPNSAVVIQLIPAQSV
jgi:hypothetical protein